MPRHCLSDEERKERKRKRNQEQYARRKAKKAEIAMQTSLVEREENMRNVVSPLSNRYMQTLRNSVDVTEPQIHMHPSEILSKKARSVYDV